MTERSGFRTALFLAGGTLLAAAVLATVWFGDGAAVSIVADDLPLTAFGTSLLFLVFFSIVTERVVETVLTLLHGPERQAILAPLASEITRNAVNADMMQRELELLSHPQERAALYTEEFEADSSRARARTQIMAAEISANLEALRQKKELRALAISLALGVAISAGGFQLISSTMGASLVPGMLGAAQSTYLLVLDILLTAFAVAGGAKLVHRILVRLLRLKEKTPLQMVYESCRGDY